MRGLKSILALAALWTFGSFALAAGPTYVPIMPGCNGPLVGNGSSTIPPTCPAQLPVVSGGTGNSTGPGATPFTASGNGATTATSSIIRSGQTINVKSDYGAKGDTLSYGDGTVGAGSTAFSSATATFTAADVGKTIIIDYAGAAGAPLVTTVEPLTVFYPAEEEHHDYFARNPWSGYCQVVVAPKVVKFRKYFSDRLKRPAAE